MNPILIVDDEAAIAMLVRRILTEAGYRCQAVTDSRAAADLLEKNRCYCHDCFCWHFPVVHGPVQAAHFPGGSGQHGSDCTGNFPHGLFCST